MPMNSSLVKSFKFVWKNGKTWVLATLLIKLLAGIVPLLSLLVMKELINGISRIFQNPLDDDYRALAVMLLYQLMITLFQSLVPRLQQYVDQKMQLHIGFLIQKEIYLKTTSVPLVYFESPEFYDQVDRVSESSARFLSPVTSILTILESIVSFLSYTIFLVSVHWSLLFIFMTVFPVFWADVYFGKKRYNLHVGLTPLKREISYYAFLLKEKQSAKELRLFDLAAYFLNRWAQRYQIDRDETLRLERKNQLAGVGVDTLSAFFYMGAICIIILLSKTIRMTIGDFISIGQAIQGTQGTLVRMSGALAKLVEDKLYIEEFFKLKHFEVPDVPKMDKTSTFPSPICSGIMIDNLSFSYANSERKALKGITLTIKPGESISIVGANGSGKTTLVKCLMGLFHPTTGTITIDGIDMRKIDEQSLMQNITAIFQDYVKYHWTVKENITIGDINRPESDQAAVLVAEVSGAHSFISKLPSQYQTMLGKWLVDGEELSGGQWQKIALARALYKDSQMIILDEPTAAIDPITEQEIFQKFRDVAKDRIAIFISHRMASAKLADRIVVMKDGEIVETGTHLELMDKRGEYYRMYQAQAQWFENPSANQMQGEYMPCTNS
ncbi:ABC transporter ATP-binding protein [Brevibacillus fluminis]|uniref:ABC transporter ATP-binding protein n=1 Tax=Brevibacillus fluminis TaxID=511487 RepID=UPI003F8C461E